MDYPIKHPAPNGNGSEPFAYTVEEAARIACLSRSTLYLALQDGTLVGRKAGRRTLIRPDDLWVFVKDLPLFGGDQSDGGE